VGISEEGKKVKGKKAIKRASPLGNGWKVTRETKMNKRWMSPRNWKKAAGKEGKQTTN